MPKMALGWHKMTAVNHLFDGSRVCAVLTLAAVVSAGGCGSNANIGGLGLASHDRSFVVAGSHRNFTCEQCHNPAAPSFSLAGGGVDCIGCHTEGATSPGHASVAGYAWATGTCISCHQDGSGGLPANHNTAFFPVAGTKHSAIGCAECHGATKAIADITCVPCHTQASMATGHAAIPASTRGNRDGATYTNYQWSSAFCLKCHADGQVNAIASHPAVQHGLSGEGHRPFCLTCHNTAGPAGGKAWAVGFAAYSCLACHANNGGG